MQDRKHLVYQPLGVLTERLIGVIEELGGLMVSRHTRRGAAYHRRERFPQVMTHNLTDKGCWRVAIDDGIDELLPVVCIIRIAHVALHMLQIDVVEVVDDTEV